jgi:hypothetical protein
MTNLTKDSSVSSERSLIWRMLKAPSTGERLMGIVQDDLLVLCFVVDGRSRESDLRGRIS